MGNIEYTGAIGLVSEFMMGLRKSGRVGKIGLR
jgi:hypothetical protein